MFRGWTNRTRILAAAGIVVLVAIAGYAALAMRPEFCRGIPRESGGCDPNLAPYKAITCLGIAEEWGTFVNDAGLRRIAESGGRMGTAATVTTERWTITQLANIRLRDLGLISECGADEFYETGSQMFSPEFIREAPNYLYDVQFEDEDPVTFEEWEQDVKKAVAMIDQDDSAPAPSQ